MNWGQRFSLDPQDPERLWWWMGVYCCWWTNPAAPVSDAQLFLPAQTFLGAIRGERRAELPPSGLDLWPNPFCNKISQRRKILNTSLYPISRFDTFHASFASGVKDNFTFFMAPGPDLSIYLFLITAFFSFLYLYRSGLDLGNHSNLFHRVDSGLQQRGNFFGLGWSPPPQGCCAGATHGRMVVF